MQGWWYLGTKLSCFLQCYGHLLVRGVLVPTAALFMSISTPPRLSLTHLKADTTLDSLLTSHFTANNLPDADPRELDSSWNIWNLIIPDQGWIFYWYTRWICVLSFYLFALYLLSKVRWFNSRHYLTLSSRDWILITRLSIVSVLIFQSNTIPSVLASSFGTTGIYLIGLNVKQCTLAQSFIFLSKSTCFD